MSRPWLGAWLENDLFIIGFLSASVVVVVISSAAIISLWVLLLLLPGMPTVRYFQLFLARSVLRRSVSRFFPQLLRLSKVYVNILYFLLFHLSLSELCLFLCSFSVRQHAHVDFQLFSQKSSGIPVLLLLLLLLLPLPLPLLLLVLLLLILLLLLLLLQSS